MKKTICVILALTMLFCAAALAESWVCSQCGREATGNFCSNCGSPNAIVSDAAASDGDTYTVSLHIDFIPNLIFSTYDVQLCLDGEALYTLAHGRDADYVFPISAGTHDLSFVNAEDSAVKGDVSLDVSSDLTAEYKISCYSDYVDVEEIYVDRDVVLAANEVKMTCDRHAYVSEPYEEVVQTLKEAGFSNIVEQPVYDIYFGFTEEGSVADVTIDGDIDYRRGDVFPSDAEIIVSYHLKEEDDPEKLAEESEKASKAAEAASVAAA